MKLNINLKRSITSICVLVIVFVSFVALVFPFSVSAAWGEPLNYQDLDYEVQLGSDYNTVTVPLPSDNYLFALWENAEIIDKQYGLNTYVIPGSIGDSYGISVYPASSFGIVMDNIPDGSILRFDVQLSEYVSDDNGYVNYELPDVRLQGHYLVNVDGQLTWVDTHTVGRIYDSPLSGRFTCEFVIQPRDYEVFSFVPHIEFGNFVPLTESLFKIEIISSTLNMEISSDYWQQWQNEQNGEMLNTINDKLDNAINGTPEQNQQAQDAVGGLNSSTDKLDELGNQMSSVEKPSIDSNKISADSLVPHTSLVVLSSPFQALWENNQLLAMLTIVVTLVLVSWVFFGKKA